MENNICKIVMAQKAEDVITTMDFVYETRCNELAPGRISAVYAVNLVTEGQGTYFVWGRTYPLRRGDLFFVFPSCPCHVTTADGSLRYIYITYLGLRARKLMEDLGVSGTSPVFSGQERLIPLWQDALAMARRRTTGLLSESVLLYTFASLDDGRDRRDTEENADIIPTVRRYIDDNYADPALSLHSISRKYSYNEKYLSTVFKARMNIGVRQYVNTVRIQNACTLMEEGMTSVKEIAHLSGFSDALYFTKVFRRYRGQTPGGYMRALSPDTVPVKKEKGL